MFKRFRDDMKKYWKYAIYSSKAQLKAELALVGTGSSVLHVDLCIHVRICI